MLRDRKELHEKLCELLGSNHVYFQPPTSLQMTYPCIRYERTNIDTKKADNKNYILTALYQLTLIEKDPDSDLAARILGLFSMCDFDRSYKFDNLNHTVLNLYY